MSANPPRRSALATTNKKLSEKLTVTVMSSALGCATWWPFTFPFKSLRLWIFEPGHADNSLTRVGISAIGGFSPKPNATRYALLRDGVQVFQTTWNQWERTCKDK